MIEVLELDETDEASPADVEAASNDEHDRRPSTRRASSNLRRARSRRRSISSAPRSSSTRWAPRRLRPPSPKRQRWATSPCRPRSIASCATRRSSISQRSMPNCETLQFDPAATPSQAMVRASHTLCGIHRTGGFPLLASTAKALEQCLLGLQARGAPAPGAALPVLARAIAGLDDACARVKRARGIRCQRRGRGSGDRRRTRDAAPGSHHRTGAGRQRDGCRARRRSGGDGAGRRAAAMAPPRCAEAGRDRCPPAVDSPAPPLVEQVLYRSPSCRVRAGAVVAPPAPPRVARCRAKAGAGDRGDATGRRDAACRQRRRRQAGAADISRRSG